MSTEAGTHLQLLTEFLQTPLCDGGSLLDRFAALPGAVAGKGTQPLQRYVYLPGTRKDRVVLVAHTDTVWDENYDKPCRTPVQPVYDGSLLRGSNPDCGIGADDRAGCAMLWALRDSGHSLLLVDGEEHGKRGAAYLRSSAPKLYRALNRHRFMLELDWVGNGTCLFNQVYNTNRFRQYIFHALGCTGAQNSGGCDLQVLCRSICGANIGIGYHNYHSAKECISLSEWERTLTQLTAFLGQPQPRFRVQAFSPLRRLLLKLRAKGSRLKRQFLRGIKRNN